MGLMDMISGLLGKKKQSSGASGNGGGGMNLPGGVQLPGGLAGMMGGKAGLLKALLPMIMGGGAFGGLGGLIGKLTSGGLGQKANSWVGTGPNEAVAPDELEAALGTDTIAKVAADAGVSHDEAKSGLATMLPKLVDHVTPGGQVPDAGALSGMLKNLDLGKILG